MGGLNIRVGSTFPRYLQSEEFLIIEKMENRKFLYA